MEADCFSRFLSLILSTIHSVSIDIRKLPSELYRRIYELMPISCVDLLISDSHGRVLLVRRLNEPAANQWWFPGGRVCYGERRRETAVRKLREEVGLAGTRPIELLTADLLFDEHVEAPRHAITTVFFFRVSDSQEPLVDDQSSDAQWRMPRMWLTERLHPFVKEVLEAGARLCSDTRPN